MEDNAGLVRVDYPEETGTPTRASIRCHPGAARTENQDRAGYASMPLGDLFLVLDGVGGQRGGGEAARLGLEGYRRALSKASADADPLQALEEATRAVNAAIADAKAAGGAEMQGMASTVALALLQDHVAYIGHIGDSRVYVFRGGILRLFTRDHSVTMAMVDRGILSEAEAGNHPSSHILTRSLGQPDATLETTTQPLLADDVLLLCSDGLWAYVPETAMTKMLSEEHAGLPAIADGLLQLALAAGAPDNVSIILTTLPAALPNDQKNRNSPLTFKMRFSQLARTRFFILAVCVIAIVLALGALLALLR